MKLERIEDEIQINLDIDELQCLTWCLQKATEALSDWEYRLRTGYDKEVALLLLEKLRKVEYGQP